MPEVATPLTVATALNERSREKRKVAVTRKLFWRERFGLQSDAAEWAGLSALVCVVVIGTVRLIGGNANNVFSTVSENSRPVEHPRAQSGFQVLKTAPSAPPPPPASTAKAQQTEQFDRMEQFAQLQTAPADKSGASAPDGSVPVSNGPMIIRTADLTLITKEFDKARAAIESTLKRHRGYIGEMKAGGSTGSGRTLTATLRVPADQLDATLAELKTLGRVESESQSGQDVTAQYVDLQARLANARNTEQRLTDLLRNRTGKLSDVLEVEQEVDRVRGEIEQMEAERKNMSNQVSFATLNATITEDYKAQLQVVPPSTSTRLSNAAVDGYKSLVDGLVGLALFLLENGPSLLFWVALLFLPARLVWKRLRRSFAQ
jgi:Flp pilus assembly pilin Flp